MKLKLSRHDKSSFLIKMNDNNITYDVKGILLSLSEGHDGCKIVHIAIDKNTCNQISSLESKVVKDVCECIEPLSNGKITKDMIANYYVYCVMYDSVHGKSFKGRLSNFLSICKLNSVYEFKLQLSSMKIHKKCVYLVWDLLEAAPSSMLSINIQSDEEDEAEPDFDVIQGLEKESIEIANGKIRQIHDQIEALEKEKEIFNRYISSKHDLNTIENFLMLHGEEK